MRDIRFRAWDNVKDRMYYVGEEEDISFELCSDGSFVGHDLEAELDSAFQKLEHLQYMQYTGLKDKNGVEIYEGDFMKLSESDKGEVKFHKGIFIVMTSPRFRGDEWRTVLWDAVVDEFEVIGNVYEHPHLLEEERT